MSGEKACDDLTPEQEAQVIEDAGDMFDWVMTSVAEMANNIARKDDD